MHTWLLAFGLLPLAAPAVAVADVGQGPAGWAVGAGLAVAVAKPLDDAGARPGSATAGALDLRLGHAVGPHFGAHLRLTGLLGQGHSGDYSLQAGAAFVELSARPWLIVNGPVVIHGGVGVGGARLEPEPTVAEARRFRARALGLALSAGVSYELGWPTGMVQPSGLVWGPGITVQHLPALGGEARLSWVGVGVTGTWYGG